MFWHPAFDADSLDDDLALLRVDGDFHISDNVVPVCLPDQAGHHLQYDKSGCVATGWGKDKWGEIVVQ